MVYKYLYKLLFFLIIYFFIFTKLRIYIFLSEERNILHFEFIVNIKNNSDYTDLFFVFDEFQ